MHRGRAWRAGDRGRVGGWRVSIERCWTTGKAPSPLCEQLSVFSTERTPRAGSHTGAPGHRRLRSKRERGEGGSATVTHPATCTGGQYSGGGHQRRPAAAGGSWRGTAVHECTGPSPGRKRAARPRDVATSYSHSLLPNALPAPSPTPPPACSTGVATKRANGRVLRQISMTAGVWGGRGRGVHRQRAPRRRRQPAADGGRHAARAGPDAKPKALDSMFFSLDVLHGVPPPVGSGGSTQRGARRPPPRG